MIFKRKPKWDCFFIRIGDPDFPQSMREYMLPSMTVQQLEREIKKRTCGMPHSVSGMRRGMLWAIEIVRSSSYFTWHLKAY